jgi:NAD(P)-dependent dehydrogenase (short-subunit alcohol dehydrogenase family)
VALVTGTAAGIGRAVVELFAAEGARVMGADVRAAEGEAAAAAAREHGDVAFQAADVSQRADVERLVAETAARFGGIDVVVANAGIAPVGMTRSIDPEAFERTIEINLLGVWRTVRACLPHMIERRGYVYITASLAAALHAPGMAAYAASKAGVEAFGDSLRGEVKHLGVDVGVGYFGFIDTDMVRGAEAHPAVGKLRDQLRGPLNKTYPLSKAGQAIADGIEGRRRWIVVPAWARALILARSLVQPLIDKQSEGHAAEADAAFMQDIDERGAAAASGPVGPGGEAARRAAPETPRGGEAEELAAR